MIDDAKGWSSLSARERQIVLLAAEGDTDKSIANALNIGVGSVKTYWERIRQKLHARSRAEIMAVLLKNEPLNAMEEAMKAQEMLRSVIEHADSAVALVDAERNEILLANDQFRSLLGESLQAKLAKAEGGDRAALQFQVLAELIEAIMSNKPVKSQGKGRYKASAVKYSFRERPLMMIQVRPATEQEGALGLPKHSGHLFKEALNGLDGAILLLSRKGVIIYATQQACLALARPSCDLIGRELIALAKPKDRQTELLRRYLERPAEPTTFRLALKSGVGQFQKFEVELMDRLRNPVLRAIMATLNEAS